MAGRDQCLDVWLGQRTMCVMQPGWRLARCYFRGNLAADGRQTWLTPGLAMLVDQNAPGAAAAWNWWKANVYSKVPDFGKDPKWAIVPRTDNNTLPPQPTTMP